MIVDAATVRKVAHLSRIAEPAERLEALTLELSSILQWVEQLDEVDTTAVEPLTSPIETSTPLRNDVVVAAEEEYSVLANAPNAVDGFFVVPKVVG